MTDIVGELLSSYELSSDLFDIRICLELILEGYKVPSELAPIFHISERRLMLELNSIFLYTKDTKQPWKLFLEDLAGFKYCNKCKTLKHVKDFHNYKTVKYSYCKACESARVRTPEELKRRRIKKLNDYYENSGPYKAHSSKRRALLIKAIPAWADLDAIKQFYSECPEGYEVDHVIPLQGRIVCGLHVETNLQYLSFEENRFKYNKFENSS